MDGQIAIDGDLIISGSIEGAGSLWVRGNIYVLGDLEYNAAMAGSSRQFGINGSGQSKTLGLTAGGNVVIGDPYRAQWGDSGQVDGTTGNGWNFTLEQAAAFNGREWVKTQPTLPGKPIQVSVVTESSQEVLLASVVTTQMPVYRWAPNGTFWDKPVYEYVQVGEVEDPVPEWVHHPSTLDPPYDNSWSEQVQVGTKMKPVYEWQQTGAVPVENKDGYFDNTKGLWAMHEGVPDWDLSKLTLADPSDPSDPILFPPVGKDAAITTREPTDSWVDPAILRAMIQDAPLARDADEPIKLDATVYSANSIFGLVPHSTSEGTNGKMRVQGALLAADVGLLAPRDLQLYHDARGKEVLDIRDEQNLGLRFVGTLPAPLPIPWMPSGWLRRLDSESDATTAQTAVSQRAASAV